MTDTPPPADDLVEQLRILQEILQRDPLVVTEIENHTVWPACVHVLDVVSAAASAFARLRQKLEDAEAQLEHLRRVNMTPLIRRAQKAEAQRDALAAEPTEAMIEAACRTYADDQYHGGWNDHDDEEKEIVRKAMRKALRALASARAQAMGE